MKKLCLFLCGLLPLAAWADSKITALTPATSVSDTDITYLVQGVTSTPTDASVSMSTLAAYMAGKISGLPESAVTNLVSDLSNRQMGSATLTTISGLTNAGSNYSIVTFGPSGAGPALLSTLPIVNGGTGQTTANNALNALLPTQTGNSGYVLTTNGTSSSWLSTLPIANGGTGQTTASGAINALLPAQGSAGGGFLTTNGTVCSWGTTLGIANGGTGQTTALAALDALLPTQTGNANYIFTTDGAGNPSWTNVFGASSGSISFYGVAAVTQYTAAAVTAGSSGSTGSAVYTGTTFTGNTGGSTAYTIGDIVAALKKIGIIKN